MSEVNLSALAGTADDELKTRTPISEVSGALKECGFGLFHIQLLFTTLVVYVASVLCSNSTSYLLTTAECDLQMNLIQKGLLNAIPYVGMIFSSAVAGFLTDAFGRKVFITWGLLVFSIFTLISASSQTYIVLVTSKFCEGVAFACYFTAAITLTSEFCYDRIRDWIMIFQSSYTSVAQVLIAAMSWGILTHDWKVVFFDGKFVLNTWNIYLFLMSLWPISACLLYLLIPESPKFLVTQKRYDEARNILLRIYKMNTRKPADTFKYKDIWKDLQGYKLEDLSENPVKETPAHHIVVALHAIKPMFHRPIGKYIVLICVMNFTTMAVYNTMRLWYPQVSTVIEYNSFTTSDGGTQDLCMMLDTYTSRLQEARVLNNGQNDTAVCIPVKSGSETYINSIIIGAVCTIPYFVQGILVAKIGKKPLLLGASLISLGAVLGIRYANSNAAVVALFALVISITQSTTSLHQLCTIEYLPTKMRSLGIGLMMSTGRIGTLVCNILFPVLLEMGCSIPFFSLGSMILGVMCISIFLPVKKT